MTTMTEIAGYIASTMVLLTFMTKEMRALRVLGIFSNIAFLTYGVLAWLPPVFCLHFVLLPVNVLRLRSLLAEKRLPVGGPALVACHNVFGRKLRDPRRQGQLAHVPAETSRACSRRVRTQGFRRLARANLVSGAARLTILPPGPVQSI
jgi:hypothetical protein